MDKIIIDNKNKIRYVRQCVECYKFLTSDRFYKNTKKNINKNIFICKPCQLKRKRLFKGITC